MNALNSNKAPVKMILRDISATMMTTLNVTLRMPKMKITTSTDSVISDLEVGHLHSPR